MKLLKTERSIGVYNIINEERIRDIILDISVKNLSKFVTPNEDDPLYYDGYVLSELQIEKLSNYLSEEIIFDFSKYYYVLQCLGIYDWKEK